MTLILGDVSRDVDKFRLTLDANATIVGNAQALYGHLDGHPDEDLVVLTASTSMAVAAAIAERYRVERPTLGVVLIRARVEMSVMAEALKAGIREVVVEDNVEALVSACKRSMAISEQLRAHSDSDGKSSRGRVILTFAPKGGCGKTTLCTNLAAALVDVDPGRVCLVDFDLDFGDVAIALQIDPEKTISDALKMQGALDRDAVESLVVTYRPRFDALLAPLKPEDAEFVSANLAADIITNLAKIYDYVVIDCPPAFSDITLKCFDLADAYILLTTLDVPALKNFKVALDTIDALGFPRSKWQIVLNRCDARVGLTAEDIERTIGLPISVMVPSSRDVPAALNMGETLVTSQPDHPVSQAMLELARLQQPHLPAAMTPQKKRRGLFRRKES